MTCKARLYSVSNPDRLVRDLCPECGAMLEPVGELAEVVGYRSIKPRGDTAEPQAGHGVLIDGFAEVLAGRRARSARAAIDAERWLDDGGSFDRPATATAALPPNPPTRAEPEA
ncbi:MAG: hypothetical protein ACJ768_11550 [Gaiellaceae bacterium]